MTTQLRTTPATATPFTKATRKATKDPADQAADQFAAMLAALCCAAVPQPQATPFAKSTEVVPADSLATPEIAVAESTPAPPTPVITLQALAPEAGLEVPETAAKDLSLAPATTEPAPAPVSLPQIPAPSSQLQETVSPSPSDQIAETISPVPIVSSPPPAIGPTANAHPVDPAQPAAEAPPTEVRSLSAGEATAVQEPQVIANVSTAEQTLQIEAARRDANLVAGYLAKTIRNDRAANAAAGVKSGNGFDLHGGDRERDSDFGSQANLLTGVLGKASFAATVRDFEAAGGASSVPSQTVSQIMALADAMGTHQTRSVRLRLRPEELGQIDIQLSRDATGRISAHISAERESARGMLSRSLDQLRETLSRAGLTVDKLQISAGPGLFAGNRKSDDTRSNTRESASGVGNLLTEKETEAGGQPRAEDQKLLSLRA